MYIFDYLIYNTQIISPISRKLMTTVAAITYGWRPSHHALGGVGYRG